MTSVVSATNWPALWQSWLKSVGISRNIFMPLFFTIWSTFYRNINHTFGWRRLKTMPFLVDFTGIPRKVVQCLHVSISMCGIVLPSHRFSMVCLYFANIWRFLVGKLRCVMMCNCPIGGAISASQVVKYEIELFHAPVALAKYSR